MLVNGVREECVNAPPMAPNIHEVLMKIDAVIADSNEQADKIRAFLWMQDNGDNTREEPCRAGDMLSHVVDISEQTMALHDKIYEISQILGM